MFRTPHLLILATTATVSLTTASKDGNGQIILQQRLPVRNIIHTTVQILQKMANCEHRRFNSKWQFYFYRIAASQPERISRFFQASFKIQETNKDTSQNSDCDCNSYNKRTTFHWQFPDFLPFTWPLLNFLTHPGSQKVASLFNCLFKQRFSEALAKNTCTQLTMSTCEQQIWTAVWLSQSYTNSDGSSSHSCCQNVENQLTSKSRRNNHTTSVFNCRPQKATNVKMSMLYKS